MTSACRPLAFAAGALAIIAVVLSIIISATLDASTHGVAIVGAMHGGFPPIGLPLG